VKGEFCPVGRVASEIERIKVELDRAGIRRDTEVAAGMVACVVSFYRFAWGESTSTERDPRYFPVLSSSREKSGLGDKGVTAKPFVSKESAQMGRREWRAQGSLDMGREGAKLEQ